MQTLLVPQCPLPPPVVTITLTLEEAGELQSWITSTLMKPIKDQLYDQLRNALIEARNRGFKVTGIYL